MTSPLESTAPPNFRLVFNVSTMQFYLLPETLIGDGAQSLPLSNQRYALSLNDPLARNGHIRPSHGPI